MTLVAFVILIVIFILLLLHSIVSIMDFFDQKLLQRQLNNSSRTVALSNNENYQNIQWTDISTYEQAENVLFDEDFLAGSNQTLDINEQLINLIGQKDRVSQEIFRAGAKVYFCVSCQLGYHEDSWQFLDMKCDQCKSSNVNIYRLPLTSVQQKKKLTTVITEVNFRDVSSNETFDNFLSNPDYYFNQGLEQLRIKNYIRAIVFFTEALKFNPANANDQANIYCNRGNAFNIIGNLQEAISDYNHALNLNPNHFRAAKNLELACAKLNSIQQLRTSYRNSTNYLQNEVYEEYISALDIERIRRNVNQTICVEGIIKGVYIDEDNFAIYFDFTENAFNGFYAYVPTSSFYKFKNSTNFSVLEKKVVVSGRITLNSENQPCIILNNEQQLRSID